MEGKVQVTNADDVVLELTLRATVRDWREIMRQLPPNTWPSEDLAGFIAAGIGATVGRVDRLHEVKA
jgi:hypothetical protein